jgi:hypothetical protein
LNAVINPVIPRTTIAQAIVTLTILLVAGFVNGSPSSSFPVPLPVPPELVLVDVLLLCDDDDDDEVKVEVEVGLIPSPIREVMVVLTKRSVWVVVMWALFGGGVGVNGEVNGRGGGRGGRSVKVSKHLMVSVEVIEC